MSPFYTDKPYLPTFCPVFQGIYYIGHSDQKEVYGWEAFMRGPENTPFETPLALFEQARRKGRLAEIDLLAFAMSCRCFAANDPGGKLFVNLFPETICSEEFNLPALFRFLKTIDLAPDRLVVEIIEGNFDVALLERAINGFVHVGIQFALDDFGVGHMDFGRWINLRPSYIKCDRSLIQEIWKSKRKLHVLKSLEALCKTDNTILLAEGIETQTEMDCVVTQTNIRLAQGFFFDRPKPLTQIMNTPVKDNLTCRL